MNQIQTTFREPTAQPALNGEIGLTSEEIAFALKADHKTVRENIRRVAARHPLSGVTTAHKRNDSGKGRNVSIYVVPVKWAKFVVARYESNIGSAYLEFLLECERVATELTPVLVAKVDALESELESMRARLEATARPKALPRPRTSLVTKAMSIHDSLMGDGEIIQRHLVRLPESKLTDLEIMKAKRVMLVLQQEGISRAIRTLGDRIDYAEQSPAQRLRLVEEK